MAAVEIRLAEAERVELLDQFWMVPSPGICQSGGRPELHLGAWAGGGLTITKVGLISGILKSPLS